MGFSDLRQFLSKVDEIGELRRINDVDWHLEIGGIIETAYNMANPPALLFDHIKGYPDGYRVCSNLLATPKRTALALGIEYKDPLDLIRMWKEHGKQYAPVQPVTVSKGEITENKMTGNKVDVLKFPIPKWHEFDGGRYVGAGAIVIMKDPDEGWVNVAIYRMQVVDNSTIALHFDHPGRHGSIIARKYWSKGKDCPVSIACGVDPVIFSAASENLPWGACEFDYAGWIMGKPIEVLIDEFTDLPIPSHAEIILDGKIPPNSFVAEGPVGEFSGYYASGATDDAYRVNLTSIMYRTNPVFHGEPPMKPTQNSSYFTWASSFWNELENMGISDVRGVWLYLDFMIVVISIRQQYPGHAMRAGLVAASSASTGYITRFFIVVDEDIDVTKLSDVLWAVATRSEPSESINVIKEGWSSSLDPRISPDKRKSGDYTNSKIVIDACKPFSWKDQFPKTNKMSNSLRETIEKKWLDKLY